MKTYSVRITRQVTDLLGGTIEVQAVSEGAAQTAIEERIEAGEDFGELLTFQDQIEAEGVEVAYAQEITP